jgi:hypothetical protein
MRIWLEQVLAELPQPADEFVCRIAVCQQRRCYVVDGTGVEQALQAKDLAAAIPPHR